MTCLNIYLMQLQKEKRKKHSGIGYLKNHLMPKE